MSKKIIGGILGLLVIGVAFWHLIYPVQIVDYNYTLNEDKVSLKIHFKNNLFGGSCKYLDDVQKINNNTCEIIVPNFENEIVISNYFSKYVFKNNPNMSRLNDIYVDTTSIYLPVGAKKELDVKIDKFGNEEFPIEYIYDEDIIDVTDNVLTILNSGSTILKVKVLDIEKEIEVTGTDLVTLPKLEKKKALSCGVYSSNDNLILDNVLKYEISEAGYNTRAGVVTALRFLTLQFPYRISYFFENGRLNNNTGGAYVDGEGRWYHEGLYLSNSKYSELVKVGFGPATWGCPLMNFEEQPGWVPKQYYPNGLDCSGFITWAFLNGGYDVSDTGAGDNTFADDDLSDLGEHVPITRELLMSDKIKAGDIIAADGHMAMIGGINDGYIYVAESTTYWDGVVMHKYSVDEILSSYNLTYVIFMDDFYGNNGNFTNYWE